ncbi:MAG: ATP-binding protein [Porticoccaceae bacterium]
MKRPLLAFLTRTLHGRLVLATFGPLFLLTVLLTSNSIRDRQRDNLAELHDTGNSAASYLATIADFALYSGNRLLLSSLGASTAQMGNIKGVAFLDSDRRVVVSTAGFPPVAGQAHYSTAAAEPYQQKQHLYFERPIVIAGVDVDDYHQEATTAAPAKQIGWVIVALDLSASIQERHAMLLDNIAIAVAVMVVAFVIAYLLSRSAIAPIAALTNTVGQMERGDLTVRAEPATRDELATLAQGINHLAESVARSQQTLEYRVFMATSKLQLALQDLQTKNQALETATLAAETANQAKGEFLARMSHELRTPLTAIQGFVGLLGSSELPPSEKSYCAIIDQAAAQLLTLIDDTLEFTRLQSQVVALEAAPFNLAECLEHPIRLLAPLAHRKGLEIVLDIYPDVPLAVVGDSSRLRQIISNLVSNAIKFTSDGHVRVAVFSADSDPHIAALEILVEDTGIGISPVQQRQIFIAFMQADTSISRRFGGAGLGLAIVKSLTELMGGSVTPQNNTGGGTTMRLSLRLPRAPEEEFQPLSTVLVLYDTDPLSMTATANTLTRISPHLSCYRNFDELVDYLPDSDADAFIVSIDIHQSKSERLATLFQIRAFSASPILVVAPLQTLHNELPDAFPDRLQPLVFLGKPAGLYELRSTLAAMNSGDTTAPASTDQPLLGVKVLVAEDNDFSSLLLKTLLTRLGCHCQFAVTGSEAIELSQRTQFDVLLIDIHMPEVNGIEAIRTIKQADNPNAATPVIVMTADVLQHEEETALALGAAKIILKPFAEPELMATLLAFTGRRDQPAVDTSDARGRIPRELFFNEIEALVSAAERAHGDGDQLREHIHQLLGIAGVFQLGSLETRARALHTLVKAGDYAGVATALIAIREQVCTLRQERAVGGS